MRSQDIYHYIQDRLLNSYKISSQDKDHKLIDSLVILVHSRSNSFDKAEYLTDVVEQIFVPCIRCMRGSIDYYAEQWDKEKSLSNGDSSEKVLITNTNTQTNFE